MTDRENRIRQESERRMSHTPEYAEKFRKAIVEGEDVAARDAVNKLLVIANQCKQDLQALEYLEDVGEVNHMSNNGQGT